MSEKVRGKKCDTSCVSETDTSYTPLKQTRRHLLNEKIKSSTITKKQKSSNKATPDQTNGHSRYIIPTEKTPANDKLSNGVETRHNACRAIKKEPQEDGSEKRSKNFEMIEMKFKFEQSEDSESNDPLDDNINQGKGLVQALPPNDPPELFNGKQDVPRKPQEKLNIYKTKEIPVSQTPVHPKQMGVWQPRFAVSHDQIMVLLAELQENPEAARGFSRMAEGRRRNKRFWTQLARTLNAVRGGAHKNADGWAKYWQDKKRNVKASVARREAACPVTDGDDLEVRTPLTDVEQRVVAIMGGLAYANGDAQLRVPVFCGEGPINSAAAAASTQSSSDDNMMEIPVTPAPVAQEDASFAQPEQAPQASPPPLQSWSSPLPSPPSQSAPPLPPSHSRNTFSHTAESLALLRSQHEEKMAIERERNFLLIQLVQHVEKGVRMLGDLVSQEDAKES